MLNATTTPQDYPESVACSLQQLILLRGRQLKNTHGPRRKASSILRGAHRSLARGRGMDFDEVRRYQGGDDTRHIDWRVTARTGEPHTKLFREERERPHYLLVDQSRSLFFGSQTQFKSVLAAHLAAHLAWDAFQRKDRVGGIVFNPQQLVDVKPRSGRRGVLNFLHTLAELNQQLADIIMGVNNTPPQPACSLITALEHLCSISKPGSYIFIISDFQSIRPTERDKLSALLNQLHCHNDIKALSVSDPAEYYLPKAGLLGISDGTHKQQIDTRSRRIRQQHQDDFLTHQRQLHELFNEQAIPLYTFSTKTLADHQLMYCHGPSPLLGETE